MEDMYAPERTSSSSGAPSYGGAMNIRLDALACARCAAACYPALHCSRVQLPW